MCWRGRLLLMPKGHGVLLREKGVLRSGGLRPKPRGERMLLREDGGD